jgi:hypothetical protein
MKNTGNYLEKIECKLESEEETGNIGSKLNINTQTSK